MVVALFGVVGVGKTTIGKIISEKLNYEFYDLDDEIKLFYNDTITNIYSDCICRHAIDSKKALVLSNVLTKCSSDTIIAMSPIYYSRMYKLMFAHNDVLPIVLHDSPENIAARMIYTDDNDMPIENPEPNRKQEIKDVKYFISQYKKAFLKIQCHYFINGKSADCAADEIICQFFNQNILTNH